MATEKKINSRIQQKHDVAANWAKATNFIPKKGEIIIYDAEYNASGEETQAVRFKIGDGTRTINNLPFAVIDYSSDIETLEQKVANNSTAIGKIQGAFETNGTTVKKATSAGTADKVANGLTIANATFDGSKPLTIGTSGDHIEIMGGSAASPNRVAIGLKYGNLMPSSYNKVTVDGYGIVTDGENVDYLTSHQSIKSINTNNTAAQTVNASEAIAGSGTINLHKVAKTGSYNDLLYKPTIPAAANNGTLTIQKNGTKVQTFTANQSSSVTANITVPTKVSELTNDSGYTTNKGTVTSVSVKMNGSEKGKVTSSGTIDLGTVLTAHQDISGKQDKITSSNKLAASLVSGLSAVATSGSYNDLSNKPTIPDVSGKANLSGGNTFTNGIQRIQDTTLQLASGAGYNDYLVDCFDRDHAGDTIFGVVKTGVDAGEVHIGDGVAEAPILLNGNVGTSGQVLTSQGAGKTPVWKELVTLDTDQDITAEKKFLNTLIVGAKDDGSTGFKVIQGDVAGGDILFTVNINGIDLDAHDHNIPLFIGGNAGTSGQVLTSQGAGKAPIWKSMPTYTLSGTTLTITLP